MPCWRVTQTRTRSKVILPSKTRALTLVGGLRSKVKVPSLGSSMEIKLLFVTHVIRVRFCGEEWRTTSLLVSSSRPSGVVEPFKKSLATISYFSVLTLESMNPILPNYLIQQIANL